MSRNIVFCIWLGNRIPDHYIYRLNTVCTELYNKNRHLEFILYSDHPRQIETQIHTHFEMLCMLQKIKIKSSEILFNKYDELVSTVIKNYKQSDNLLSRNDDYFIEDINLEQLLERPFSKAWRYLYTSYLYFLYVKNTFHARVSLNLRLLALAIHGGLYFDMDIMSSSYIEFLKFQKTVNTYIHCKKDIMKYYANSNKTFNDLMKFIKKISQKYDIHINTQNETYLNLLEDYLKNSLATCSFTNTKLFTKTYITTTTHVKENPENLENKEYIETGIFAITNYINKMNHNAAFSQNILYVNDQKTQKMLEDASIYSLQFNMKLMSLQPNSWILLKTVNGYKIINSNVESNIQVPFDVFLSRAKFPFLIEKNDDFEITYRTGRPLHPLGQIATRGCWNFIVNKLSKRLEHDSNVSEEVFHMKIWDVTLFPESAIIDSKELAVHSKTHWTKAKNRVFTF